jgi:hypothetical protein
MLIEPLQFISVQRVLLPMHTITNHYFFDAEFMFNACGMAVVQHKNIFVQTK